MLRRRGSTGRVHAAPSRPDATRKSPQLTYLHQPSEVIRTWTDFISMIFRLNFFLLFHDWDQLEASRGLPTSGLGPRGPSALTPVRSLHLEQLKPFTWLLIKSFGRATERGKKKQALNEQKREHNRPGLITFWPPFSFPSQPFHLIRATEFLRTHSVSRTNNSETQQRRVAV